MKLFFRLILCFLLFSCSSSKDQDQNLSVENDRTDSLTQPAVEPNPFSEIPVIDATALEPLVSDTLNNAVYYITVADTGKNYFELHKSMDEIATDCKWSIDTLGKEYNPKKRKIAMPENSQDEIYAGEYYPRRYTSNTLSLEYLNFYCRKTSEGNMALITNICEEKDSALFYARKIPQKHNHVFVLKSNVYIGCMH